MRFISRKWRTNVAAMCTVLSVFPCSLRDARSEEIDPRLIDIAFVGYSSALQESAASLEQDLNISLRVRIRLCRNLSGAMIPEIQRANLFRACMPDGTYYDHNMLSMVDSDRAQRIGVARPDYEQHWKSLCEFAMSPPTTPISALAKLVVLGAAAEGGDSSGERFKRESEYQNYVEVVAKMTCQNSEVVGTDLEWNRRLVDKLMKTGKKQ